MSNVLFHALQINWGNKQARLLWCSVWESDLPCSPVQWPPASSDPRLICYQSGSSAPDLGHTGTQKRGRAMSALLSMWRLIPGPAGPRRVTRDLANVVWLLTSSTSLAHFMMCWNERSLVMSYTRNIPCQHIEAGGHHDFAPNHKGAVSLQMCPICLSCKRKWNISQSCGLLASILQMDLTIPEYTGRYALMDSLVLACSTAW